MACAGCPVSGGRRFFSTQGAAVAASRRACPRQVFSVISFTGCGDACPVGPRWAAYCRWSQQASSTRCRYVPIPAVLKGWCCAQAPPHCHRGRLAAFFGDATHRQAHAQACMKFLSSLFVQPRSGPRTRCCQNRRCPRRMCPLHLRCRAPGRSAAALAVGITWSAGVRIACGRPRTRTR